eukprot:m.384622 g.384622  ORF g.384622 m.384622 type:complete len:327 (+) comp28271_c2_seq3:93-1073(+)
MLRGLRQRDSDSKIRVVYPKYVFFGKRSSLTFGVHALKFGWTVDATARPTPAAPCGAAQTHRDSVPSSLFVSSAVAITMLFIKLLQFGRVSNRFSGPVQLLNLYMSSIASFVAMMFCLFVGFAFSLMALHARKATPWANVWESLMSLLYLLMGEIHPVYVRGVGDFENNIDHWVADANSTYITQAVIVGLFIFIGSVFLLNVLVAVLNIEYSKLAGSARWRSEQASAILELQLWELLFDARSKWLYRAASPQPFSPLQLAVTYDNPTMRWLLDVNEGERGGYWMHLMPPDDSLFWNTVLLEHKTARSVYDKVQDVRTLIRSAKRSA